MLVTLDGIVMLVILVQSENALSPIPVTVYSTSFTVILSGIAISPLYFLLSALAVTVAVCFVVS